MRERERERESLREGTEEEEAAVLNDSNDKRESCRKMEAIGDSRRRSRLESDNEHDLRVHTPYSYEYVIGYYAVSEANLVHGAVLSRTRHCLGRVGGALRARVGRVEKLVSHDVATVLPVRVHLQSQSFSELLTY